MFTNNTHKHAFIHGRYTLINIGTKILVFFFFKIQKTHHLSNSISFLTINIIYSP